MPIYEFECPDTGERSEHFFHGSEAPGIGSEVEIEGRKWRRIPSLGAGKPRVWSREFVARSQALWHPDAPRHNDVGEAVFRSQREVDEFCAKTGQTYG